MSGISYDMRPPCGESSVMETIRSAFAQDISDRILGIAKGADAGVLLILMALVEAIIYKYENRNQVRVFVPEFGHEEDNAGERFLDVSVLIAPDRPLKELLLHTQKCLAASMKDQHVLWGNQEIADPKNGRETGRVIVALDQIHGLHIYDHLTGGIVFFFERNSTSLSLRLGYDSAFYMRRTINALLDRFFQLTRTLVMDSERTIDSVAFPPTSLRATRPDTRQEERGIENDIFTERNRGNTSTRRKATRRDADVDEVAEVLREFGVAHGARAGLMMRQGRECLIGIPAVLKAGGEIVFPEWNTHKPLSSETTASMDLDCILTTEPDCIRIPSFRLITSKVKNVALHHTAPREQITDLDTLPLPDRTAVEYGKYAGKIGQSMVMNSVSIQATRGCPYSCAYCHRIWPNKHVYRSAENIFEEVKKYYDMGIRRFSFIDDIFNLKRENCERFFNLVGKNRLKCEFYLPSGLRGDLLTFDLIDCMAENGVVELAVALETASPRIQKFIRKHLDLDSFRRNVEYIIQKYPEILFEMFTMHGFPTETEDEAGMTLDFVKSLKWIHFPYVYIVHVYPETDLGKYALESGISKEAIETSLDTPYHAFPETLPFSKEFSRQYQAKFLEDYFLCKERLKAVLPHQMRILSENELIQKYNSYVRSSFRSFDEIMQFLHLDIEDLGETKCKREADSGFETFQSRLEERSRKKQPEPNALRILLLDVSMFLSSDERLVELIDPPLGLMSLVASLRREFDRSVDAGIAKGGIDFESFQQLKSILVKFRPDLIGIRALSINRNFFHSTAAQIRQWGFDVPIIAGGPYASSGSHDLLKDVNVDAAVVGEGERTLGEIVRKMLENGNSWPSDETLQEIRGIAYVAQRDRQRLKAMNRKLLIVGNGHRMVGGTGNSETEPRGDRPNGEAQDALGFPRIAVEKNGVILSLASQIEDSCRRDQPDHLRFCGELPPIVFAAFSLLCYEQKTMASFVELKNERFESEQGSWFASGPAGSSSISLVVRDSEIDRLQTRLKCLSGSDSEMNLRHVFIVGGPLDEARTSELDALFKPDDRPTYHSILCTRNGMPFAIGKREPGSDEIRMRCLPLFGSSIDISDRGGNAQGDLMWGEVSVGPDSSAIDDGSRFLDENWPMEDTGFEGRWIEDGTIEIRCDGRDEAAEASEALRLPTFDRGKTGWGGGAVTYTSSALDRHLIDRIKTLWAEVLPVSEIGEDDDFIELGGDLYGAIRIASKADRLFEANDLFAFPSPRLLAQEIAAKNARTAGKCNEDSKHDELEERISGVWKAVLRIEAIETDSNFFELGGTSFKALQIVSMLEGICTLTDLYETLTIANLVERIRSVKKESEERRLLIRIVKTNGVADTSLICIPYGGGNAIVYEPLAQKLRAVTNSLEVLALQPPGHDPVRMDEMFEEFEIVSRGCTEEIQTRVDGEIALYGHCVGAVLALDIAKTLNRLGRPIKALIVGGFIPIGSELMRRTAATAWDLVSEKMIVHFMRNLGALQGELGESEREYLAKCFRFDAKEYLRAFRRVHKDEGEPWPFRLHCLVGTRDLITKGYKKKYKMWERFSKDVNLRTIKDADHYFINSHAEDVAKIIADILEAQ